MSHTRRSHLLQGGWWEIYDAEWLNKEVNYIFCDQSVLRSYKGSISLSFSCFESYCGNCRNVEGDGERSGKRERVFQDVISILSVWPAEMMFMLDSDLLTPVPASANCYILNWGRTNQKVDRLHVKLVSFFPLKLIDLPEHMKISYCYKAKNLSYLTGKGTKLLIPSKVFHPPLYHTLTLNNRSKLPRGSRLPNQADGCSHCAGGWVVQRKQVKHHVRVHATRASSYYQRKKQMKREKRKKRGSVAPWRSLLMWERIKVWM